jgi:hypothetical protein
MRFVTRTRVFVCGFVALVAAVLFLAAGPAVPEPHDDPPAPATGADFHPTPPTRVLDTRAVGAGGTVTVDLRDLVPNGTAAVVLNVTGTNATAATAVTTTPTTATLRLVPGRTRASLVTTATDDGRVSFHNRAGSVALAADLEGYYSPTGGAEFTPVTPVRVLDSRFSADATHQLSLAGRVPPDATAVALTVTGLEATRDTSVTVWPDGDAEPAAPNVYFGPGATVANQVIVGLGPNSAIDIRNLAGTAGVLVDLAGYYTTGDASSFSTTAARAVLDRSAGPDTTIGLDLSAVVPPSTTAVVLNLTGTATARTSVTAWPDGTARSGLVLLAGQLAAGTVTVPVGPDGIVDVHNRIGTVRLHADLVGYFAPPTAQCATGCALSWGVDGSLGDRGLGGTPAAPLFGLTGLQSIASTHGPTVYGLGTDGSVWTWGRSGDAPVRVPGITSLEAISAAVSGGFGLRSDGTVWSFGDVSAITGHAGTAPAQVRGLAGVTAIASGATDLYALRADGIVVAVGDNTYGQLGNGRRCACRGGPTQVSGLTDVTAVSGGFRTGFALRADGTVWAWGYNAHGLHTGTDSGSSTVPLRVNGLSGITAIATGTSQDTADEFGFALRSDGTVRSVGYNVLGELGNGTHAADPTWSFTPTTVTGLTRVTAISAGTDSGYALLSDGTARAWGSDDGGLLDDGRQFGQSDVPVTMADAAGATAVFGGYGDAFALFADGR